MISAAVFPPSSLAMKKRVSSNLQADQALVISREKPNPGVRAVLTAKTTIVPGRLLSTQPKPTILVGTASENYKSFHLTKTSKVSEAHFIETDGLILYDIYGNAGTRDGLKRLEASVYKKFSEEYPNHLIKRFPNQEFDHALNKNIGIATKSRTESADKVDWDYCNGTKLTKKANIAKTSKTSDSLMLDSTFNYENGALSDLLTNHGTRGIISVEEHFDVNPPRFSHQKTLQIAGLRKALAAQLTLIDTNFTQTYQIAEKDEILALDMALVRGTFPLDSRHTQEFALLNKNQTSIHLDRCLKASIKRLDFLESGIYHLSQSSPKYADVCRKGISGELFVLTNVFEEKIGAAKRLFPDFDEKILLSTLETFSRQTMFLRSNSLSTSQIKPRDELFEYGKEYLQLNSMDGTFGRYWHNKRLVEKNEKSLFVDDIVVY